MTKLNLARIFAENIVGNCGTPSVRFKVPKKILINGNIPTGSIQLHLAHYKDNYSYTISLNGFSKGSEIIMKQTSLRKEMSINDTYQLILTQFGKVIFCQDFDKVREGKL